MMNSVGLNSMRNTLFGQQTHRKQSAASPSLTSRETEILSQIQKMVGGSVKVNEGSQSACGLNIALIGFNGASVCGTRSPFMVTPNMLREMAEDDDKFQHWMSWIQQGMQRQTSFEGWLQDNKRQAEEMDADRRSQQIRTSMMSALDFWNENSGERQSWVQLGQGQAIQQKIARFEQA